MKLNSKKILITGWVLILGLIIPLYPQQTKKPSEDLTDGPYIFYLNREAVVCSVIGDSVVTRRFKNKNAFQVDVPAVKGLCVTIPAIPLQPPRDQFRTTEKVFAISDVHGQFLRMKEILVGNRVMDPEFNWVFKKGHLVMVGDVFDRGPMVTECLWLLVHLERQASRAGGRVHLLLGNHDQMVIRGDLRYVNDRYKNISRKLFKIRYPDLFGPDTFLGRWLRFRPAVLRINDTLFVHAGIHPHLVDQGQSIQAINRTVSRYMDSRSYVHAFRPLVSFIFGRNGVFWSRGYFQDEAYDPINRAQLLRVLKFYKAQRVVVGHTRHDLIATHMDGLVIGTAVNTEENQPAQGLLIMNGRFYRSDVRGDLTELFPVN